jgi:hypothetical protein
MAASQRISQGCSLCKTMGRRLAALVIGCFHGRGSRLAEQTGPSLFRAAHIFVCAGEPVVKGDKLNAEGVG